MVESIVYPIITKGYLSLKDLMNPETTMTEFAKAIAMVNFDDWFHDYAKRLAQNQKQDTVEYFE